MKQFIGNVVFSAILLAGTASAAPTNSLESGFLNPPAAARPWVYWFWLNGNITEEGLTADLEAMTRAGIGGVLIMEIDDKGAPAGPVAFMSDRWLALFRHMLSEAARLGIEVNMNNEPGYAGSGGPWVPLDKAMQVVVSAETRVKGGTPFSGALPQPEAKEGFYRDIAVLAYPPPAGADDPTNKIQNHHVKSMHSHYGRKFYLQLPAAAPAAVPEAAVTTRERIIDLTGKMDAKGTLVWDAPATGGVGGEWTVVRFGHTFTGAMSHPAPAAGIGPACDKLSPEGIEAHYRGMIGKMVKEFGPHAGKVFTATHVDSWETGAQNWTPKMREEFRRLRGYDMLPFLPVLTGQIVDSPDISERFLRDLRLTISDLMAVNYVGRLRQLANADGLRLSMEAYSAPANDQDIANHIDEPICEFWWPNGPFGWSAKAMSSVAHVNGLPVVGAELFTANQAERWQAHPGTLKAVGDQAFCEGVNRFIVHRYAMQPWKEKRWPGMAMGPWGVHYERSTTWWEDSKAWHRYVQRCQYMLREGRFVADVLVLQSEEPAQRFAGGGSLGYDYDGISPQAFRKNVSVKDGRLVLPSGMSYRLLVLPTGDTMSPQMLEKIANLIDAGAKVIGKPPTKAPGLSDYPQADERVRTLAARLWSGDRAIKDQPVGEALAAMGVVPDFESKPYLRYIHRSVGDKEVYFVANGPKAVDALCTFRVTGKSPEAWDPESGRITPLRVFDEKDGRTRVQLRLEATGSLFVVFQPVSPDPAERIVSILHDGKELLELAPKPSGTGTAPTPAAPTPANTFSIAAWVKPDADTALTSESNKQTGAMVADRNEVLFPPPGHEIWGERDAGVGFAVGRNGVCVTEHGANHLPAVLEHPAQIDGWTHVAVIYQDGTPSLYLNGVFARKGLKSAFVTHPGVGVRHGRGVTPFRGKFAGLRQFPAALSVEEIAGLARERPPAADTPALDLKGMMAGQNGTFTITTADGKSREQVVSGLTAPMEITGPWEVSFPPGGGAPEKVSFDRLISWSDHPDNGVKYYSGSAVYRNVFDFAPVAINQLSVISNPLAKNTDHRSLITDHSPLFFLDLGQVAVMAEVKVNGKDAGVLWKPPFRADITKLVRPGSNSLEVRVVNLPINRMIGDELLPEDSDRKADGSLNSWPQWLQEGKPSPTGRITFTTWRLWKKDEPLQTSGLLGPVTLETSFPLAK